MFWELGNPKTASSFPGFKKILTSLFVPPGVLDQYSPDRSLNPMVSCISWKPVIIFLYPVFIIMGNSSTLAVFGKKKKKKAVMFSSRQKQGIYAFKLRQGFRKHDFFTIISLLLLLSIPWCTWESLSNNHPWHNSLHALQNQGIFEHWKVDGKSLSTTRASFHYYQLGCITFIKEKNAKLTKKGMHYCRILKIVFQDINHTESCEVLADNKCVIDWSLKSHAYYEHNPHFNAGS